MRVPKTPAALAEFRKKAIAAAYMEAQGVKRSDIAKRLDYGEPGVAILLKYAEREEYLSKTPTFLLHNVSEADWHEVRQRFLIQELFTDSLSKIVPANLYFEAHMIYGGYRDYVHGAAVCVWQLLRHATRVGSHVGTFGASVRGHHQDFRQPNSLRRDSDRVHPAVR